MLVYVGHTSWSESWLFRAIFFVHMPLFFWVSGMLFEPMRYGTVRDVVKKTVVGLGVPYLFFVVAALLIKFDIQVPLLVTRFPTQVYGLFVRGDCIWALWFLVCLASTRIAYYLIYRAGVERNTALKSIAIAGILLLAEISLLFVYPYRKAIPLMLSSMPATLFFFSIGRWMGPCFGKMKERFARLRTGIPAFLICLALCIGLSVCLPTRTFDLRNGVLSILGLLPCAAGLVSLVALASIIGKRDGRFARAVTYIGQNSLIFFAMEQNASHIFTLLIRACGFEAPEIYYSAKGMLGLKIGRLLFCLFTVALVAPMTGALVKRIQKRIGVNFL